MIRVGARMVVGREPLQEDLRALLSIRETIWSENRIIKEDV